MFDGILESATGQLAHVTGPIPDVDEKWVPWWDICLVKNGDAIRTTIVILIKVGAVPRRVKWVLFRIQVIRCSLALEYASVYARDCEKGLLSVLHLMMSYDCVHVDKFCI